MSERVHILPRHNVGADALGRGVEGGSGLDVHQATVAACLLIVSKSGKVHKPCAPSAAVVHLRH